MVAGANHGDEPWGLRARRRRRVRSLRLKLGVLGLVLGTALAAFLASAGSAGAYATRTFEIGEAVDTGSGSVVRVHSRSFTQAVADLDATEGLSGDTKLRLDPVGQPSFTLTGATITVRESTFSITLRGESTNFNGYTGNQPVDVLVLLDWTSASGDTNPSIVVSGTVEGVTLADVFGLDPNLPLVGGGFHSVTFTSGFSPITGDDPTDNINHIARTENLPPEAKAFYEEIWGEDEMPTPLPALSNFDKSPYITAAMRVDELGPVKDVLSLADDSRLVVEGGFTLAENDEGQTKPKFDLRATLPRVELPDIPWLEFPVVQPDPTDPAAPTAEWAIAVGYDDGDVSFELSADTTVVMFGVEQSFFFEGDVEFGTGDSSDASVEFTVFIEGDFFGALGIDFIDVNRFVLNGKYSKKTPSTGAPVTTLEGTVTALATILGQNFTLNLAGSRVNDVTKASIDLAMDGDLAAADVLSAMGLDVTELHESITLPTLHSPGFSIEIEQGKAQGQTQPSTFSVSLSAGLSWEVPTTNLTLAARTLAYVSSSGDFAIGIRTAETLRLSDLTGLISGLSIPGTMDLKLAGDGRAFGVVINKGAVLSMVNQLPMAVRRFYRPLYGRAEDSTEDFRVDLKAGLSVLGTVDLPTELAKAVGSLGVRSNVRLQGTLPIFGLSDPFEFGLTMEVAGDGLPDFISEVIGTIRFAATTQSPSLKVSIDADVRLRFRTGLPAYLANPLIDAGIPVQADEAVEQDTICPSGAPAQLAADPPTKPHDEDDEEDGQTVPVTKYYCFDEFTVGLTGSVAVTTTGISFDLVGDLRTPIGQVWRPFGLPWVGIESLTLKLGVSSNGTDVGLTIGMQGGGDVAGRQVFLALQVRGVVMAVAPFVRLDLDALTFGSGTGIGLSDVVDIYNAFREGAALLRGEDPPEEALDLDDFDVPDVRLKNLLFSFSPAGVPDLCVPQGVHVAADLYIDASGFEPTDQPSCQTSNMPPVPKEGEDCISHREDGCVASGRLSISKSGIFGSFQVPHFDLGFLELDDFTLDVAVSTGDTHLIAEGGGRIPGLLEGEFKLALKALGVQFYGFVDVLGFSALVDATAGFNLLTDPSPNLSLHVLLATNQTDVGSPSFSEIITSVGSAVLSPVQAAAIVFDGIISALDTGNPLKALANTVGNLSRLSIPVPSWLQPLKDAYKDFMKDLQAAIKLVPADLDWVLGQIGASLTDVVLNGFPGFTMDFKIGKITVAGVPGICKTVFDLDGHCTISRLLQEKLYPFFDTALEAMLGFEVDTAALIRALVEGRNKALFSFDCAEFSLDLSTQAAAIALSVSGQILGVNFGTGFDVTLDFSPEGLASLDPAALIDDFIEQLLNPGTPACTGYNEEIFGVDGTVDRPPPALRISAPPVVVEGEEFTLDGTVTAPAGAATAIISASIGDGESGPTSILDLSGTGPQEFSLAYTYPDDDPTGTERDASTIGVVVVFHDDESKELSRAEDIEVVAVRNVRPEPSISLVSEELVEGRPAIFGVTFDDPGLYDSHVVEIDFGDHSPTEVVEVDVGTRSLTVEHTYVDDDPSETPVDDYPVTVRVLDDDIGEGTTTVRFPVANDPPTVTVAGPTIGDDDEPILEGSPVVFTITFDDDGEDDFHEVVVDFGDGSPAQTIQVEAGERSLTVEHTYVDDDPTATPDDTYELEVTVIDDDLGEGSVVETVTVDNVSPSNVVVDGPADRPEEGPIIEGDEVQLLVTFDDPGIADTHQLVVDYDDGQPPVTVPVAAGAREQALTHIWGDNGAFTVEIAVVDDDTGRASVTETVVVINEAPELAIDLNSTFAAPSGPTFMTRIGLPFTAAAAATDPGSDDLRFTWDFGESASIAETDLVNPPDPDPDPSPSVQPRAVVNEQTYTYQAPCLRTLRVDLVDDDLGTDVDEAPVVAVGDWRSPQPQFFWETQYLGYGRTPSNGVIPDATLACHVATVRHLSSVFGEVADLDDPGDAHATIKQPNPLTDAFRPKVDVARDLFDRELLALWLNVAAGATGTDTSGMLIPAFAEAVYAAEQVRLDPAATAPQLEQAVLRLRAADNAYTCRVPKPSTPSLLPHRDCLAPDGPVSAPPVVELPDDLSIPEGNVTRTVTLPVRLSQPRAAATTVHLLVSGDGTDIGIAVPPVTIPAGATGGLASITVRGDTAPEPDESFTVRITSVEGAAVGPDDTATITLLNDDAAGTNPKGK